MSSLIEPLEGRQLFVATHTGLPDASFANGGVATVSFRSTADNDLARPVDVLVDSGGRSYVIAQTKLAVQVKRVDTFGVVDSSYGNARGFIGLPVDSTIAKSFDGVAAALDLADRLLVLAGNKLYRFTVSGKTDRSFGTNGVVDLSRIFAGTKDIAVDGNDRINIVGSYAYTTNSTGSTLYQMRITRLRASGAVDPTFGSQGIYTTPQPGDSSGHFKDGNSIGTEIRVSNVDGSIIAAANATYTITDTSIQYLSRTAQGVEVTKFISAGVVDNSYGTKGTTQRYDSGNDVDYASISLVGIRANGTVVILRSAASGDSEIPISSAKNYLVGADGNPNHTFYVNPSDGSVTLGGTTEFESVNGGDEFVVNAPQLSLYHRNNDGTLDTTFTGAGSTTPITGITRIALAGDGTVVTLNSASKALALNVGRIFGSAKPVANLASKPTTAAGAVVFNVVYKSQAGFATHGAIDGSEVSVIAKDGTVYTPLVFSISALPGNVLNVRYRLTKNGGSFTKADDGQYEVDVLGGQVTDANGQVADATVLGNLTVAI